MGAYILDPAGTFRRALGLPSSVHSIVFSDTSSHVINIEKEMGSLIRYCANQAQIDESVTNIPSIHYDTEQTESSVTLYWAQDASLSLHKKSPLVCTLVLSLCFVVSLFSHSLPLSKRPIVPFVYHISRIFLGFTDSLR